MSNFTQATEQVRPATARSWWLNAGLRSPARNSRGRRVVPGAITASAAMAGQLDVAVGNILGGIAIPTVVLVVLDAFGVRPRVSLTRLAASLLLVLEGTRACPGTKAATHPSPNLSRAGTPAARKSSRRPSKG
jgi:hypothetical protein